jgi:hypothetical protein
MANRLQSYRQMIRGEEKGALILGRGVENALREMNTILIKEVDTLKEINVELV